MDNSTRALIGAMVGDAADRTVSVDTDGLPPRTRRIIGLGLMIVRSNLPDADFLQLRSAPLGQQITTGSTGMRLSSWSHCSGSRRHPSSSTLQTKIAKGLVGMALAAGVVLSFATRLVPVALAGAMTALVALLACISRYRAARTSLATGIGTWLGITALFFLTGAAADVTSFSFSRTRTHLSCESADTAAFSGTSVSGQFPT